MEGRWIIRGILVLAAIVGVTFLKTQRRADDSKVVRAEIVNVIHGMDEYPKNRKLFDMWTESAHGQAFDAAYKVGGRRQATTFDEDVYIHRFFQSMIDAANGSGRSDLARPLLKLQGNYDEARDAEKAADKS